MKIVNWKTFCANVCGPYRERILSFGKLGIVLSVYDEKKLVAIEFFNSKSGFYFGKWQEIFLF